MNINKEEIINMLAQDIPTSQIAAVIGVDDSYISQLKHDPEIQELVAAKTAALTAKDLAFDDLLQSAEEKALERIEKNLHFANMGQALGAFKILNGAKKRRDAGAGQQNAGVSVTVNLTLPTQTVINFQTNSRNEIVEVEGKTMISATARSLDSILAARADASGLSRLPQTTDMEKAANRLDVLSGPVATRSRPAARLPSALSADIL